MDRCCDTFLQHRASATRISGAFFLCVCGSHEGVAKALKGVGDIARSALECRGCARQVLRSASHGAVCRSEGIRSSACFLGEAKGGSRAGGFGRQCFGASGAYHDHWTGHVRLWTCRAGALAILGHVCELLQREERDSEWLALKDVIRPSSSCSPA